jgi:alpha-glucosidase
MEKEQDFSGNYIEKFEKEDHHKDLFSGLCTSWEKIGNRFYFHAEFSSLEVTVLNHDIIKFRYGNDGYFEDDFSYAVTDFEPEDITVDFRERSLYFALRTDNLKLYVYKDNLKTKIIDKDDHVLLEDEKGYHWQEEKDHGGNIVICTKKARHADSYYALGDKTGNLNLRNTRRQLWGTDCYGYGNDTDPVYKNIPFYMGITGGNGYGIFMDNTFRSFFDFAYERKSVASFWAQGGEMRYYFINGPKLMDVAQRYTDLTGRPQLPPKWTLGYHQSKWSYYPEETVRELAKEFRDRKIPCDVIHLDIDYMDGYRCFTWDKSRFPNPKKMITDLKEDGFRTIVIIDPGIKIDKKYRVYQEGMKGNYFCVRGDGPLYKGSVWPGECHFPDFTNPAARKWWTSLFEGLVADGVDGVWNDMNEPAEFEKGTFPFDVRHDFDGHPCTHRKAHNVYGSLMAQSTYEGLQRWSGDKRAFTITRSAYAGVQKHASVWTGDNVASWEHLKIANIQCQRLSMSGVSFTGSDVGGFVESPDGELYTRWMQMAVFHPFYRTHSSGDHGDKEPWVFEEEYLNVVRRFIELRYELVPYIYSTFYQYATQGTPMIRSMALLFQKDLEARKSEEQFMFGDYLLIKPVAEEGLESDTVYLPAGTWFDFWTHELYTGRQTIEVDTPLDRMPIFVKGGAVVPFQPKMQYTDEFIFETLTLDIYLGEGEDKTSIYEDAGEGFDYREGNYLIRTIKSMRAGSAHILKQMQEGKYESTYSQLRLNFYGFNRPKLIAVDGNNLVDEISEIENGFSVILNKDFNELVLT